MSMMLFNIYLMGLEIEMRKEQTGDIVLGKEKIWSISYDDIMLLAKNEQEVIEKDDEVIQKIH